MAGVFMKICSFWACFFGFAFLLSYLLLLLIFRFVEFSSQDKLGLFFVEITYFWLVFQIYLASLNSVYKHTFLAKNDQVARTCRTYG